MLVVMPNDLRAQSSASSQVIPLNSGWNLISIQVGSPVTPEQFKSVMLHPDRLQQVWGYVPSGNSATPGHWNAFRASPPPGYQSDLNLIEPGKGYWVKVSQSTSVSLSGSPWDGSLDLLAGWNLVGFPGVNLAANEEQELSAVFGANWSRIQQVWSWNPATQQHVGYDLTAIPQLKDLAKIQPAAGYWVYALEPISVTPAPYVALPGDADASPLETEVLFNASQFPAITNASLYAGTMIRKVNGAKDAELDLNGNGIIDSAFTQDTLKFDIGVDRKVITVGNNGTGLANWIVDNSVPWLFTAAPNAKSYPNNAGRPKSASGVVSADRDSVTLYADTTGLLPGPQTGQITVRVGNIVRTITVKLDVPTSSGDWKGYATTQRVNGKTIPIGSVDMGINLFMLSNNTSESRFRAVLNKDTSLLFPRDVFMDGVFYSGNQFSLTTNFEMPAGDRNAPPFDTFPAKRATGAAVPAMQPRADYDADGNGKLNAENPFSFPIRREITLLGRRLSPNRMEGNYVESITGVLPSGQPIFVEGTFFLDRQTLEPTKRSIFNQTTTGNPISIGGSTGPYYRETTINVSSAVSIASITLTLNLTFPDPTKLTISLIGPNGKTVVIHNRGATLPASIVLADYNNLLGNGPWKLRVEWIPTGERGTFTSWGLDIQGLATYSIVGKIVGDTNGDSVNEPLPGAHLVLSGSNLIVQTDAGPFSGTATTTAGSSAVTLTSGTTRGFYSGMAVSGNTSIPAGATVGSIQSDTTLTLSVSATGSGSSATVFGAPGEFGFPNLTENNYSLSLSRPGFEPRLVSFFINNANLYIGQNGAVAAAGAPNDPLILTPVNVSTPTLRAGPFVGQEPLHVDLTALVPLANLNALGTLTGASWNFGDGSPVVTAATSTEDEVNQTTAAHIYEKAGVYTATVTLTGTSGSLPVASQKILVHRMVADPAAATPSFQVLGVSFVGAFAAPLSNGGSPVQVSGGSTVASYDITNDGQPPLVSVATGKVYQESRRDTAGFDMDRFPKIEQNGVFQPNEEDSDFGDTSKLVYVSGDGSVGLPYLIKTYAQLTANEQADAAGDVSPNTYKKYVPPTVANREIPDRFRVVPTLGGSVFAADPPKVGDFVLQVGRVEP